MQRWVGDGFREAVGRALEMIPDRIVARLGGFHFFCGADPVFAGLTLYEDTVDDRSYRETAHVLYEFHQGHRPADDRPVTVALPVLEEPEIIVHELGHVLDHATNFIHDAKPVTRYAKTNRREAFAEAFTAWTVPSCITWQIDDPATAHFFESL